jgi:hypothetical protein
MKQFVKKYLDTQNKKRFHILDSLYTIQLLKEQGFKPKTIFDVGFYKGEFPKMAIGI